jgi:low temperature requirement protein LtrA
VTHAHAREVDTTRRFAVRATDPDHRVTVLELLFDLVFVFAITEITSLLTHDPTWRGVGHACLLVALIWGPWMGFSWLGNIARADESGMRAGMIVAMIAVFGMAIAIPGSFAPAMRGVPPAMLLVVTYAVVRMVHLTVFLIAASGDPGLQRQLRRFTVPLALDVALLGVGATLGGAWQIWLWVLALVLDYSGTLLIGAGGWRLVSTSHFAERHGLIVIIALGESIVAVGAAVTGRPLVWPVLAAVVLGLLITVCLWWLYFDVDAPTAERALTAMTGPGRSEAARDAYSYLHLPMVGGIVFMALGLRQTLSVVAEHGEQSLRGPLSAVAGTTLLGGVSIYLLAHAAFRWRLDGTVNRPRILLAAVLAGCVPAANVVPALISLLCLTVLLLAMVSYEYVRGRNERVAMRASRRGAITGEDMVDVVLG